MDYEILKILNDTVRERSLSPVEGSYTNKLLTGGANLIVKKLGEENAEFIRALLTQDEEELAREAADCLYHLIVALRFRGVGFEKVAQTLRQRLK